MLRKDKEACSNCMLVCANCDFYDPDHVVEVYKTVECHSVSSYIQPMVTSGSVKVKEKGACKLDPDKTPHKKPDDWCGQHSEYRK